MNKHLDPLKKKWGALFLLILLFGQLDYFIHLYLISKSDNAIDTKIEENDFQDNNLLEIKVALHLPYYTDQSEFHPSKGEISYKGKIYNYVKTKIKSDTLILLCLSNNVKTELLNQFSLNFNRTLSNFKWSIPTGIKLFNIFGLDFISINNNLLSSTIKPINKHFPRHFYGMPTNPFIGISEVPPDLKSKNT